MVANKIIYAVLAGLLVAGLAIVIFSGNHTSNSQGNNYINTSGKTSNGATSSNTTGTLFASTQYAQFAYLISNSTLSSQAQAALSGFNLTRTQYSNGTVAIGVMLLGSGNKQTLDLKPGYKLYIIETSFGDDSFGGESNLGDDGFVEVNPNGYIVQ
jgi:hypothetical protein